jgi:uncharacterized membrane protein YqgA involved in biofilm formation
MTGTIINVIAILVGGILGTFLGSRLPERLRQTVMTGLGLFVLAIGVEMFLDTKNSLVVLGSLVFGILLGEWWQVEEGIRRLGRALEDDHAKKDRRTTTLPASPLCGGFFTHPCCLVAQLYSGIYQVA